MLFEEIILQTPSLADTRRFYTQTLELPLVTERPGALSFDAGRTRLTFEENRAAKPFYHFAFNVTVNRFSDCFEWLDRKIDILPVEPGVMVKVYPPWNAQSFYFHDNTGNILECIVRFGLPYTSSAPFSPQQDLVEVSEIGYVTDNVPQAVVDLGLQGIPKYPPGPHGDDFTAMGDEQGLVLVTAVGRGWIPTNRPAKIFPLTVRCEGGLVLQTGTPA